MLYRHEWKYVCSDMEAYLLNQKLKVICAKDSFSNIYGNYNVRSLYFDDVNNSALMANINGINPRQKYRIRIYNGDISTAKLELKSKVGVMTYKESCRISEKEVFDLISKGKINLLADSKLKERFLLAVRKDILAPKVIVDYERTAWVYEIGNVRITFDKNIGSSDDYQNFSNNNIRKKPILSLKKQILEVKWDNMMPDHISNILCIKTLQQTSFSKYCLCRLVNNI